MARARANDIQKSERLNLARSLLAHSTSLSQAAHQLAQACSISKVQAYRYLRQAQQLKRPVPVGDTKVSFTVKLSRGLIDKVRTYAASTGLTLSEIVSRALLAVLHRGGGRG
jgi:predicted DNA-binding transcriptional regulator YafY